MRAPLKLGRDLLCRECVEQLDLVVNVRVWLPAALAAGQIETSVAGIDKNDVETTDDVAASQPVLKCPKCGEEYELPGEVIYR